MKQQLKSELLNNYPLYCELLVDLEKALNKAIDWYRVHFSALIKAKDYRPGTIGRYFASSIAVRFQIDRTYEYLKKKDWDEHFLENYTFDIHKETNYLGVIKNIDVSVRFYLFHSFYHQLETTIRILVEELNLKEEKGKPIHRVNKLLKCFPEEFISCIDALRNSIHNNGYYIPIRNQPKQLKYVSGDYVINFKENEKLEITTIDVIHLVYKIVEYSECMLQHDDIIPLPIRKDRS